MNCYHESLTSNYEERSVTSLQQEIAGHDKQSSESHYHGTPVSRSCPPFEPDLHGENTCEKHFQFGLHLGRTAKKKNVQLVLIYYRSQHSKKINVIFDRVAPDASLLCDDTYDWVRWEAISFGYTFQYKSCQTFAFLNIKLTKFLLSFYRWIIYLSLGCL